MPTFIREEDIMAPSIFLPAKRQMLLLKMLVFCADEQSLAVDRKRGGGKLEQKRERERGGEGHKKLVQKRSGSNKSKLKKNRRG